MAKDFNKNISRKQMAINMAANIVSYSANIIISFILTPFLINTLGKETYSFYPIANTIVSYLSVLTNAMNSMASRFVTVSIVKEEDEEANKYFSSTFAANLILSGLLLIPMALIVILLDRFMEVPVNSEAAIKALFVLVFSSALINISSSVFGIATFAKNRIDLRSLRELVTAVLRLLLFFLLYRFLPPSIVYVGIVALAVATVNILFQIFYTRTLLPDIRLSVANISLSHTKELFKASIWNAINTFGNTLLAGLSMVLANVFYGASASGSYSIVNTVPQFINGVIVMLVGIFYPVITYRYAASDKSGMIKEIKTAQSVIGILGCSIITVFSALASEFFSIWTPGENGNYLSFLSLITIIPHLIICCMWSLTNLNVVMNKVKIPALYTLFSGMMNLLLSYLVYRIWSPGLISLPIISSSLQVIWIGIFIPLYACRNLKVNKTTFYPVLIKALTCSVISFAIIAAGKKGFVLNSWLRLISFGGLCGIVVLCFMALVVFGPKETVTSLQMIRNKIRKK
ncbi:MAG: oligosaccharide flippase family protein [Blautia sp.]|nr:oligosaccharide flippase family protein [Blautia sp.]